MHKKLKHPNINIPATERAFRWTSPVILSLALGWVFRLLLPNLSIFSGMLAFNIGWFVSFYTYHNYMKRSKHQGQFNQAGGYFGALEMLKVGAEIFGEVMADLICQWMIPAGLAFGVSTGAFLIQPATIGLFAANLVMYTHVVILASAFSVSLFLDTLFSIHKSLKEKKTWLQNNDMVIESSARYGIGRKAQQRARLDERRGDSAGDHHGRRVEHKGRC